MKHKMTKEAALNIAIVRGIGFSIMVALYMIIGFPLRSTMWCAYVGFLLCVAVGGIGTDRLPNAILCTTVGFGWAAAYMELPKLLNMFLPGPVEVYIVVAELIVTFCILFGHLYLLQNTRFNLVPFIFGAVACTFGKGDLSFVPLCWVSIVIGILTAFLTGVVIEKTKPKQ